MAGITDDKFDILANGNFSKILFYKINNYRKLIGEETFKVKNAVIGDYNYALEKMQSKNWSNFVEGLIEISECDITALDCCSTEHNFNEIKIAATII